MPSRYRMYIDESGDHIFQQRVATLEQRYLGLTGVIFDSATYRSDVHPELEQLKQSFFPYNPDEPVILVRNRIIRQVDEFKVLKAPVVAANWENDITAFFQKHIRRMFTVVIDKQAHIDRYGSATYHPYHYCFTVLMERYRGWLNMVGGRGDVMVESRNGRDDTQLKRIYGEIWENGTGFLSGQQFRDYFTSKELKLKKKQANIAGLQVADLTAYPSKMDILLLHRQPMPSTPSASTARIADAIRSKYNQFGRVFLN